MDKSRLTEAVQLLMRDDRQQWRLREAPADFAREHGLTDEETDALLNGDELRLISLGVPPSTFHPQPADRSWLASALLRAGAPALAVLAALGVAIGPAPTARAARAARHGIVIRRAAARAGRFGRAGRYIARPLNARAARLGIREGRFLRTDMRMARFARAGAFGNYSSFDAALTALQQVDPKIGGEQEPPGDVIIVD